METKNKINVDSSETTATVNTTLLDSKSPKFGAREFSGIWSKEEAEEIENIIAKSCTNIHPDDWK
jgi:hypothetical protein